MAGAGWGEEKNDVPAGMRGKEPGRVATAYGISPEGALFSDPHTLFGGSAATKKGGL